MKLLTLAWMTNSIETLLIEIHFDPYKTKPVGHDVQMVEVPVQVLHEESQTWHVPVPLASKATKKYPSLHLAHEYSEIQTSQFPVHLLQEPDFK